MRVKCLKGRQGERAGSCCWGSLLNLKKERGLRLQLPGDRLHHLRDVSEQASKQANKRVVA